MFHLEHINLKGDLTIGMDVMWHSGMFVQAWLWDESYAFPTL
jgi:hypothetical protein